ncbi:MAG TPA: hypothetical protein ENH65_13820, partial [Candidatus Aminicenantes bacterium]|nr:hypothetical protein [Candidatus Aminicenantes bacterium]
MKYIKFCPACGAEQTYTVKEELRRAQIKNLKCRSCSHTGLTAGCFEKGHTKTKGNDNPMFGRKHTIEARRKMCSSNRKRRKHSAETICKMRISAVKRLKR